MTPARKAPLRVAVAVDAPEHEEAGAIVEWLTRSAGVEALPCAPSALAELEADVVWLHGVRALGLEALGPRGPDLLSRGRILLTGGAAVLPAAAGMDDTLPNESDRAIWPDALDDDGLPPVRGHASLRGHPLFDGLGHAPLTSAPRPGEEHTMVAYVLPNWPARAHVVAVERTRTVIGRHRATIWEYDRPEGRTLCIGGFLPFHSRVTAMRANTERLARNALVRAAAAPRPADRGETWLPPAVAAREDPELAMPDFPALDEPLGGLEFRLRTTGPVSGDTPFSVAGRRAFAAGGVARGIDEVWAHPVRVAVRPRIAGANAESFAITPVAVERKLGVGSAEVIERVVVPRDGPVCVIEWLSATRLADLEIGWTCDLRLAPPYPAGAIGALRWRRCARGLVVAGSGEDRAVFVFSAPPGLFDVEHAADGDGAALRVMARIDLRPGVSLRLAIVGGADDRLIRRALAAANRAHAITRARRGHAERLMTQRLALDAPEPAAGQAIEWAKQRLAARLVEAPGVGRSLVDGYDSHRAAARFAGPEAVRAALACLAAGDFRTARDVLSFLGKHQDPSGRVLRECTTSGVARHDAPDATPLYLLLAARYLAWTGDLGFLRLEWPRILRAYDCCRASESPGTQPAGGATLASALPELADAAEAIGERGVAAELRATRTAGVPTAAPYDPADHGPPGITDLVHGILGAEPDATRGRLVLRPVPPPSWHRFRVSGLAVGETSVTLDYRRSDALHTFRLVQDRGAAPLQLILEASLPGSGLQSAVVDGVAAALEARRDRDRIVVPVQVVLDHAREVVLEMAQARRK